jgi:hypothetical protein
MTMKRVDFLGAAAALAAALFAGACDRPAAPAHPTWTDVQPILAGECNGCHGATADATGFGLRFDFFDMTADTCGDAAQALGSDLPMAHSLATKIWNAISTTSDQPNARPLMPPQPAPSLSNWEWETIQHWTADGAPKGDLPPANRPPRFLFFRNDATPDQSLDITALVEDPDGDPVVGLVKLGQTTLKMDRSGSFSAHLDTSSWAPGQLAVTAVLCDGWSSVAYSVATLTVQHGVP